MNVLLASDIEALLEDRPSPCISLYFPLFRSGARTREGPIRLRNLLARVGEELRARKLDRAAVETVLGPLEDLVEDLSFWDTQEKGVALFRAPGFTQVFQLPQAFAERYVVSEHFFLKPLLPLVTDDDTLYVLALSQNEVRLLEATCRAVRRLEPMALPHSLTGALGEQVTPQSLTYHTASSAPEGALPPIYHGRGSGISDKKAELRRYLRQVEGAVSELLAGRSAPLVLAGAEPLPSIYRELTDYAGLAAQVVSGNPENLTNEELRDRAWRLLRPAAREVRRRVEERFGELAGTGQASNDVSEIVPAARHGRVEALFLACDTDVWGRLDALDKVVIHSKPEKGDEELLDAAALLSLRHGARVFGLDRSEVPGGGDLAAVFRY